MLLRKLDNYKQNNETRLLSYTIWNHKIPRKKHKGKAPDIALGKDLFEWCQSTSNKVKNK